MGSNSRHSFFYERSQKAFPDRADVTKLRGTRGVCVSAILNLWLMYDKIGHAEENRMLVHSNISSSSQNKSSENDQTASTIKVFTRNTFSHSDCVDEMTNSVHWIACKILLILLLFVTSMFSYMTTPEVYGIGGRFGQRTRLRSSGERLTPVRGRSRDFSVQDSKSTLVPKLASAYLVLPSCTQHPPRIQL